MTLVTLLACDPAKSGDLQDVVSYIRSLGLFGQSNHEIAELAHLSEGTVKNHVSTLLLLFARDLTKD